ncbi:uncharacterized protein F5Z01DRAFT_670129 [Emericellopsis atlantica]|uniref:Condensation domain-containing protein n=1 Tax=Emericellopsis atlantica TaxID=2614577 RepID=A0A9P7ZV70_9HYPO|nr:uncharacterized protein F5Z01DRAFT_670129 [Emericellopsis atlantica]KAG9258411.1 hypothetical protein F5Z01DRAFT_670129 [Emericellopsis atlantica]
MADGGTVVPRVIPDEPLNEIHNVSKRSISKQEDLCIGILDANRSHEKYSQIVGYFVNMLPFLAIQTIESSITYSDLYNRFLNAANVLLRPGLFASISNLSAL